MVKLSNDFFPEPDCPCLECENARKVKARKARLVAKLEERGAAFERERAGQPSYVFLWIAGAFLVGLASIALIITAIIGGL